MIVHRNRNVNNISVFFFLFFVVVVILLLVFCFWFEYCSEYITEIYRALDEWNDRNSKQPNSKFHTLLNWKWHRMEWQMISKMIEGRKKKRKTKNIYRNYYWKSNVEDDRNSLHVHTIIWHRIFMESRHNCNSTLTIYYSINKRTSQCLKDWFEIKVFDMKQT